MSEGGAGVGSENPGVGGSIPSLPTMIFKQLPVRKFLRIEFVPRFVPNSGTLQPTLEQEANETLGRRVSPYDTPEVMAVLCW